MNVKTGHTISIVIPNYNNSDTIGTCLEAIHSSGHEGVEVVVVDDGSRDGSTEVIRRFPCRLIELHENRGASCARNRGASASRGDFIFFTDADCIADRNTLSAIRTALPRVGPDTVMGGTYARTPHDRGFFNLFQAVFVYYSETKRTEDPDYIAAHAMLMKAETFRKSGGFPEKFMPILEDVEFSHRIRKGGCRLVMDPDIQVKHIFNFSLARSLRNAVRKTRYWTMYSLKSRNTFVDSGSSSTELKLNVFTLLMVLLLSAFSLLAEKFSVLYAVPPLILINAWVSRRLLWAFYVSGGAVFALFAATYYMTLYALSVGAGAFAGVFTYALNRGLRKGQQF
jgi:GT2 family glycosyltransferase